MFPVALNPGFALLLGAILCMAVPGTLRGLVSTAAALAALACMFTPGFGEHAEFVEIGVRLVPLRLDALSQTFGVAFAICALALAIYGGGRRSGPEEAALLAHAGGAVAAAFAGDLISFIAFSELSMMAGAGLLLQRDDEQAQRVGMRLFGWQSLTSSLLVAGAGFAIADAGHAGFDKLDPQTLGGFLIFAAFGVKAVFPIAHVWLKEATTYASPSGSAALLAFTPGLGLYGLLRGFTGESSLIWIGLAMALFPALYAGMERDFRRALAYGFIAQIGLAVAAAGLGGAAGLAAGAAHGFAILVAFMLLSLALAFALEVEGGAAPNLGFAQAPVTGVLAILGALSIAGAPGTIGFASISLLLDALARHGHGLVWAAVMALGLGAAHTSIRFLYTVFLAQAATHAKAPPLGARQWAMLVLAVLIFGAGLAPEWLYNLLPPYPARAGSFDFDHFLDFGRALLIAAPMALALWFLWRRPGGAFALPDVDVIIHGPIAAAARAAAGSTHALDALWRRVETSVFGWLERLWRRALTQADRPDRPLQPSLTWILGTLVGFLVAVLGFLAWK